jgi:hypothetical protein
MTDLFGYHAAREQMADLRRTAGQTRLVTSSGHARALRNGRRLIAAMLSRVSAARSSADREPASQPTPGPTPPGA